MRARLAVLAVAAGVLAGCASAPRASGDLDRYLEEFEAVRSQGERLYLQAGAVADERAAVDASTSSARAALEARLDALRLVARYNRLLIALARGEDPKALKSELKSIGGKLSDYKPGPQAQQYALASAIPYLGALVQGAAVVRDALAKRRFMAAVHGAEKPIAAILDILIADSSPLEELLVQELRRGQDPFRVRVDAVGGRFYRKLAALADEPRTRLLLDKENALRARAGRPAIPHEAAAKAAPPTDADLDLLQALVDETESAVLESERAQDQLAAQRSLFSRYRETLEQAKASLAALNGSDDARRDAETGRFSARALDLRRQAAKEGGTVR